MTPSRASTMASCMAGSTAPEVVGRVRELMECCRLQGYRRDEVIAMIESLP